MRLESQGPLGLCPGHTHSPTATAGKRRAIKSRQEESRCLGLASGTPLMSCVPYPLWLSFLLDKMGE